jgi:flagellin
VTATNTNTGASQTVDITSALFSKIGSYDPTANLAVGTTLDVAFTSLGITASLNSLFDKDANIAVATTAAATNGTNQTLGVATAAINATGLGQAAIDSLQALSPTVYNQATGALTLTVDSSAGNITTFNAVAGLRFQLNGGAIAADNTASGDFENGAANIVSVYLTNGGSPVKIADLTIASTTSTGASGAGDGNYALNLPVTAFGTTYSTAGNTKDFSFKVGTGTSANDSISISIGAATAGVLGVGSSSADTAANSDAAITAITGAINTISSRRSDIGSSQSRLEFAINNINVAIENTTAATSALLDVDVSSEISKFTGKQVLLQAGVSLLAQANQQPALLLRLLQ